MTNLNTNTGTPKRGATYTIAPYVERLEWGMYLFWINGIVLFGGIGGFAFFDMLPQGKPFSEYGIFLGSFLGGLGALAALIHHITSARKGKAALVIDENTVTVSLGDQSFNFGMLDSMLWYDDFRQVTGLAAKRKRRIAIVVTYRSGTHFQNGKRTQIYFFGYCTPAKMAELQKWYLQTMYIVKSRRKFQRDNVEKSQAASVENDVATLADLITRLKSASVIDEADLLNSTAPEDKIDMLLPQVETGHSGRAAASVSKVLSGKPFSIVSSVWFGFLGVMMMLLNGAFLFALIR